MSLDGDMIGLLDGDSDGGGSDSDYSGWLRRGFKGDLPASTGEAIVHDGITVVTGAIPMVPSYVSLLKKGRKLGHPELSGVSKGTGFVAQLFGLVVSTVDPTSVSDLLIPENTMWYLIHKKEVDKLHSEKKLWRDSEY